MALEWITGERISLVFQGAIGHKGSDFGPAARAARAAMPDAEIILSTWEGATVDPGWPLDRVVYSPDPGPVFVEPITRRPNNVLRQATSTFAGLMAATRPFAAKIRTDLLFSAPRLPVAEGGDPSPERPVFGRPVSVPIIGTRDAVLSGFGFHPSDFFSFGQSDDMRLLWNFRRPVEIMDGQTVPLAHRLRDFSYGACYYRYPPEQELILSLLVRQDRAALARRVAALDRSAQVQQASLDFLQSNFRAFSFRDLGLTADPRLSGAMMVTRNVDADPATGQIRAGHTGAPAWVVVDAFLQNLATLALSPLGASGNRMLTALVPAAKRLRARLST